jgi:hypothetical protein
LVAVLEQFETQDADVEGDRLVVVAHEQRDVGDRLAHA